MQIHTLLLLGLFIPLLLGGQPQAWAQEAETAQPPASEKPADGEKEKMVDEDENGLPDTKQIVVDLNNFVNETLEIIDLARIRREKAPPPLTVVQQRQKDLVDSDHPFTPEAFLNAAKEGDEKLVLQYLKAEMPPNKQVSTGQTALHYAVIGNRLDIAQMLLTYNANPNQQDGRGDSPLHLAVERNLPYMVALLASQGGDTNLKNNDGWSPVHLAAYNGFSEIFALLLKHGGDINLKNRLGLTPLMLATWKGHQKLAAFLLEMGADTTPEDPQGNSAFLLAVSHNRIDLVKLMLQRGANPNTTNGRGWSALDIALESQFREIANMLYAAGAEAPGLARTQGRILNADR